LSDEDQKALVLAIDCFVKKSQMGKAIGRKTTKTVKTTQLKNKKAGRFFTCQLWWIPFSTN